jgi:hypothetical protein
MSTKTFILSNLAIAVVGGIGGEVVASPEPVPVAPLASPSWTDDRDARPMPTLQWSNPSGNDNSKVPQWLKPNQTGSFVMPQWLQEQDRDEEVFSVVADKPRGSNVEYRLATEFTWSNFTSSSQLSFPTEPDSLSLSSRGDAIVRHAASTVNEGERLSQSNINRSRSTDSPLTRISPMQPTAEHLEQGEVVINVRTRTFFLPDFVDSELLDADTGTYPNLGFTWGITDNTELTLEYQRVDSASPARQGDFIAILDADEEISLDLKQQFWENSSQTLAISGVLSLSYGNRDFIFSDRQTGSLVERKDTEGLVVGLQAPFTATIDDRLRFTVSPTLAFFSDENALFYSTPPITTQVRLVRLSGLLVLFPIASVRG